MTEKKVIKDPKKIQEVLTQGVPLGRWKEGLMFEGVEPMPWLKSAANWFPNTEEIQPDEMRITFMGSSPSIRPGQMNTSIFVELGNGDSFIFDIGEGAISNYVACRLALNELNDIFITHLHVDHFGALPFLYMFGAWGGRWHEPLRVTGPSGRTEKDGIAYMIDGMKRMLHWHRDAFDVFPIGEGYEIDVNEFNFRDDGGVCYEKNGVTVSHWRQSHAKDGASAYRLDWNGLSMAFTGDGRPNSLTEKYAAGVDVLITELQPEVISISSGVMGVPPFLGRYTVDTHHNPGYAAGYLYNKVKPRLALATHVPNDEYSNAESLAEVREHWKGPFHFGFDLVVANITEDKLWIREGVVSDFPNNKPPQFDLSTGYLHVPQPRNKREDIQEPTIREAHIAPEKYYPEGYHPVLLEEWPVDGDLQADLDLLPEDFKDSVSENYRRKERLKKAQENKND